MHGKLAKNHKGFNITPDRQLYVFHDPLNEKSFPSKTKVEQVGKTKKKEERALCMLPFTSLPDRIMFCS